MELNEALLVGSLRHSILLCAVMQDGLIDEEVSVAHTGHFLHEIHRVELQVVTGGRRLVHSAISLMAFASRVDKQLLVEGRHVDFD